MQRRVYSKVSEEGDPTVSYARIERAGLTADVDGDGDTDVLSASRYDHEIAWYENDLPLFCDGFESGDLGG